MAGSGSTRASASGARATVPTDVITALELRAGEPFVRVEVSFENRSRDHRVRFHVPLAGLGDRQRRRGPVRRRRARPRGRGRSRRGATGRPSRRAGSSRPRASAALLDHIVEYEVVDGRELALTLLRSFGWISRNANPYREDPAGPEVPVPGRAAAGRAVDAVRAACPTPARGPTSDVLAMAERYQHGALVVRGPGPVGATAEGRPATAGLVGEGLAIEGDGVVLTALRRRGEWLELRLVAETAERDRGRRSTGPSTRRAMPTCSAGRSGALRAGPGTCCACRSGRGRSGPSSCGPPGHSRP